MNLQQAPLQSQRHGSFRVDDDIASTGYIHTQDGFTVESSSDGARTESRNEPVVVS